MVLGIIGSLEIASLVPSSWRLSASMVLQTTAIAIVLYIVFRLARFLNWIRWVNKVYGDLPGPKERHWFFGSLYYFPKGEAERLQHFLDLCEKYGDRGYIRFWTGLCKPVILLCAPDTMKQILKTAEPKPTGLAGGYRFVKSWLGDGLLIAAGEKWARNRRLLTPAFHFDILKPYVKVYNKSADILIHHIIPVEDNGQQLLVYEEIRSSYMYDKSSYNIILQENLDTFASEGTNFELFQEICKCTLDIILKCAFSYETNVQKLGETSPYVKAVTSLSVCMNTRFRTPYLYPDFIWNLSSPGRQFNKDCEFVHSVAEDIIGKRQHTLEKEGEIGRLQDRKYLDFLDILLTAKDENGKGLSPIEIRNEVDTFLFEGHDTTASAISWILYSLAEHQDYQQKCQQEIDGILEGRENDEIEWNDLSQMEYLTMCIKEGLRLHCPVPMLGRQIKNELFIGDRVFPKDTTISVNIWALHHNKKVWEKDMEYIPERFSKENILKMDHYQFVPFAAGPRNCIGQHFAMNEEKVVIAKLLRKFTFELVPGHVVRKRLAVVMRAENGIMMQVRRRHHSS